MKIVFVNRYFYPDISATSQLLTDLALHLAALGHRVSVICSTQLYEDSAAKLTAHATFQGIDIHRVRTTHFGRASLAGRACDYLSFYLTATTRLLRLLDPSTIVVAETDPPLISVAAAFACKVRGGRLVNWVQDVFPEIGERLGMRSLSGNTGRILRRIRDASLRVAEVNVVLGTRMAELLAGRGVPDSRLLVIPNWSVDTIDRHPKADLTGQWGLGGKFVVMYSGNMGRAHDFETQLDAATKLNSDDAIQFLWVGGGAQKEFLRSTIAARVLKNCHVKPYLPRELLNESLAVGHIHLISLRPELEGLIVPSKFYGVIAAGRPTLFIGAADGELARWVVEHDVGCVVAQGDSDGLARTIQRYDYDRKFLQRQSQNALLLSQSKLSRKISLKHWQSLFEKLEADPPIRTPPVL